MIKKMFAFVLIWCSLFGASVLAQSDCSRLPDGPCCWGCHSYTLCQAGVGTSVDCPLPDLAFNYLIGDCDSVANTPPPCGQLHDCTELPDQKYPDMTPGIECQYFFTCENGVDLGTTPCNAPDTSGLVFDVDKQYCDYIASVPAPCGTLPDPA